MEGFYPWVVFVHVIGAFGFALSHGVSAAVALRLREEREVPRVRALLELSSSSSRTCTRAPRATTASSAARSVS